MTVDRTEHNCVINIQNKLLRSILDIWRQG